MTGILNSHEYEIGEITDDTKRKIQWHNQGYMEQPKIDYESFKK